ncbi:MAG: Ig-like domain-containing protein, partial [Anaeroplasmataceae bacterium]|nr:Ig-like domain-containing protein [Anaeroplasmataceae bacterium]
MAKFKKLFLSAAMLLGICVIGGGLTTHADDGDQEPAELTENFSFVEEFNYNSDGVGEPGKDNEYNIFSAQYTNTNEDGALSLEKKGEYDALKLVAARIDSSQNILAVAFRDQGKPIYDNEENPNAIIKIRYLSDNQGGNNIDFCLMFNKDELDENCPDNQCRYQFRIRGGNNRDLQQGRYPSESVQAVSTANGKFTEKVWHELTFILEDNGDLESDGTSPDKIYAYLDDEFLMERTFHNNDNYHGKLTQFYYYTQCNSAYDRRTYIDYIKVGPYNKAVATEPEISTVKVNLPFDLNPLVVGENENYLPSLSKYTVDFSVNEEQLVATTQDGVTSYTLNDEVVLTYQNGKYVASKTIANLKATFNFADHSLDPMSVTFDIEENNEPIPVTDIQTNPVVRNNTITLGVEEEYDLDKLFAAYPEGADETTLAYEVVSGNDVVSIEDGVLKGLSVGTATIKVSATDESGVEKEVTVNVSSGAYASLNDYALEDAWETANHTASGFTSVAYSNKTYAQISVQEDSVFGNVICIAGNGGKDSSGAHLDKYVPVSELSANKNYKLTAWIKLNPEAAEKTSGTSLDLKIFAYYYENGRYSYGEQGSAYGNQVRTFKADLVNGWVYVESPAVNLDTNAIGHAFEGFKLELGLWNAEAGVNAYITHLALVEVEEDVNAVDWNLVDDNNHALDTTNNLTIQANSTYQINAVSIPSAGTISPTFASGDETIATVDENGLVTILNQIGTVTITVTVGGASKEITFDVKKSAESITLDSETINIILHSFDPRRGVWNITVTPADSTSELVATVENEDVCTATIVDNKLYISNPVLGST